MNKRRWLVQLPLIIPALAMFFAGWQAVLLRNQISEMKNENRPWVGFELQQLNTAKRGEPLGVLVKIKNVGKSPAVNVHGQVRVGDLTSTSADRVAECRACSNSLLLPGADATYPPVTMTAEQTDYKKYAPAIFGRVDYEDEDGHPYWTTLCEYYEVAFSGLGTCSSGNSVGASNAGRRSSANLLIKDDAPRTADNPTSRSQTLNTIFPTRVML